HAAAVVEGGATAGLAISRAPAGQPVDDPAAQPPLSYGCRRRRDQEGRNTAQLASFVCDPLAREQARYPNDSGFTRPQAAGYDRALHTRRPRADLQGGEPARSADQEGQEGRAAEGRAAEVAPGVRAPSSSGGCGYFPQPRRRLA